MVIGGYKLFCFIETLTYPSINDNVSIGKCNIHNSYCIEKTNKSLNIIDTLSTNKDEASRITDKITIQRLIEALEERDKQIILLRFYKDKTQTEVAKILGISQVQVSRIEKRILSGMKTELVS